MRVGKRERAAIRLREAESRAIKARAMRVSGGSLKTSLTSLWPHEQGKCRPPSAKSLWSARGNFSKGHSVSI